MIAALTDKPMRVLLALLALTGLSWLLGAWHELDPAILGAMLLIVAFVKARLVIVHFMEIHQAPWPIRCAFEAWVLAFGGITIGLYL